MPPDAGENAKAEHFGGGNAGSLGEGWDEDYTRQVEAFLGAEELPEPFCLVVSLVNPHDVLGYPAAYRRGGYSNWEFRDLGVGLPPTIDEDLSDKPTVHTLMRLGMTAYMGPVRSRRAKLDYVNFYAHLHRVVDEKIGRVLGALGDPGDPESLRSRTVIVRCADHGEMGLSHGGLRQKMFNTYEETLRVPLVVSNPLLFPKPERTEALASLVDVLPTILTLAGAGANGDAASAGSARERMRGRDLAPVLAERAAPEREALGRSEVDLGPIVEHPSPAPSVQDAVHFTYDDHQAATALQNVPGQPNRIRAVRTAGHKYAFYFDPTGRRPTEHEMYDLERDPDEARNLVDRFSGEPRRPRRRAASRRAGRAPRGADGRTRHRARSWLIGQSVWTRADDWRGLNSWDQVSRRAVDALREGLDSGPAMAAADERALAGARRAGAGRLPEGEVEVRLATVRIGIWLTIIVALGSEAYAVATWDQPNRGVITAILALALVSAAGIRLAPMKRIIRSRWREPFFLAWSIAVTLGITGASIADGGTSSPYILLFVLPILFASLSYPLPLTLVVGAVDVAAFGVVAATAGDLPFDGFGAFTLFCAALLAASEARNQASRRRALRRTAEALRRSEGSSWVQARQQQEVARIGQLALSGAQIDELLEEALQIVERVLEVEVAGVLKLLPDESEFVVAAVVGVPEAAGNGRIPAGMGSQAGYTLLTAAPVTVTDWESEDRFGQSPALAELSVLSGATVPIRAKGEPYGVLGAHATQSREFTAEDVSFLQAIANVLANAIERRLAEDRTRYEAVHDPLTGLPNRNLFLDRLSHGLLQAQRRRTSVAVLFLDLDEFKLVNDSLGHAAGDELLAAVAPRLQQALRPGDTVARFGGDEFAVLAEDVRSERDATRVAERIADALARPFVVRRREHFVSASIGISIAGGPEPPEALLRDADAALYRAKARGRGGYEIFDRVMRARAVDHMQLENDLRRAINRSELELYYQPVVALADGSITAFEALLRWRHPARGLIGPAEFIPVAEESRLIVPIGRWVIEEACRKAAAWQALKPDEAPVEIAVNLSARQIADPGLPKLVADAIQHSGIDAASLNLELTESVLLEESDSPERTLESLRHLGVHLVLDDFGIGFSSLGYLKRFPLSAIKLDRSFLENVSEGAPDRAIVRAVVEMARALGLDVVAEGVETVEQLRAVRELGCEEAQGFYFTRPVPADEVIDLLHAPPWRDPRSIPAPADPSGPPLRTTT